MQQNIGKMFLQHTIVLAITPVNTDLTDYVTQKALDGLFYHIGLEEQKIRKDPAARVTDILKKVFGNQNGTG